MKIDLQNRNAIVCGSTQGIGKAIAIKLATEGVKITLLARNKDSLERVLRELPNSSTHSSICADFSNPRELEDKINDFIKEKTLPIHILVNNTGGPQSGLLIDASLEDLEKGFKMHVLCNQILVNAVMDSMKSENYGRIINIISTSVKTPLQGLGVSNTIRGAVANWSKTMANELGSFGITVNNILPGFTDTERLKSLFQKRANDRNVSIDEITAKMIETIPAKRIGTPEDIAYAVAFLCSPQASYINGINLPIDGGRTPCL